MNIFCKIIGHTTGLLPESNKQYYYGCLNCKIRLSKNNGILVNHNDGTVTLKEIKDE